MLKWTHLATKRVSKSMLKKIFYILLLSSCFLTSCEQRVALKTKRQQILKLNAHSEPLTVDPRRSSDLTTSMLIRLLYDGLFREDPSGTLLPSLAKSYTLSDSKTIYTFSLKKTRWSDTTFVTAFDFERAWKKTLDPTFPAACANLMYSIKNAKAIKQGALPVEKLGVKAIDEQTLQVELEAPLPYFLNLLALPTFFCTHPSLDEETFKLKQFVGNGPFILKQWVSKDFILVEKNPLYWDKEAVKLKKVHISLVEDEHTELNLFESQELHWAGSPISTVPTDAIEALKSKKALRTHPLSSTYWYKFNVNRFPFNNKNLRKAFAYAINRREIIEHITQANQTPALSPVPPIYNLSEVDLTQDGNLELARGYFEKGLAELGITKEELGPISLTYSTGERHQKITQAIQQQWKKAFDIEVKLQNFEWQILLQKLFKHDFQVAGRGWVAEYPDPMYFLEPYMTLNSPEFGGNNDTGWHNKEFIALLEKVQRSSSEKERIELMRKAEAIFIDEMPVIPFFHSTLVYLKDPNLQDVCLSSLCTFDFKWASFTI